MTSSATRTVRFSIDLCGCRGALGQNYVHSCCMQLLTSPRTPLLKEVRRAASRGGLTDQGLCVAEGFHSLVEALRSNCEVSTVFAAESARGAVETRVKGLKSARVIEL